MGFNKKQIIIIFIDYGTDDVKYEHINIKILSGNANNMPLFIYKDYFGAIDYEDSSFHG